MSIDWSKAPEGTTHWDPVDKNHLRQYGKVSQYWNIERGWSDKGWQYPDDLSTMDRLIARPVWEGKGMPPVGSVCEMRLWPDGEWEKCTPAYYLQEPHDHSEQVVVYQHRIMGDVHYIIDPPCSGSIEFRPLRTPEQIAADERLHKIRNAHTAIARTLDAFKGDIPAESVSRQTIEAMIDAGYVKP